MNKLAISAIAAAVGLAFSAGAMAQAMSKDEFKSGKNRIAVQYKADKTACGSLAGNAKDICKAEAVGKQKVAIAELDANYKPSGKATYKASTAKADAAYVIAKEKCDDKAGNEKDICIKQALALKVAANADAKAQLTTSNANQEANKKVAAARMQASDKRAAASDTAATAKRDAEYAVAKEKCDTFAADAKANCIKEAKLRFGQS